MAQGEEREDRTIRVVISLKRRAKQCRVLIAPVDISERRTSLWIVRKFVNMFPYEIKDVDDAVNSRLLAHFSGERDGFVEVGPKKWILPAAYRNHAEKFYTMPVRSGDIWVVTFPRSGTTMCQELTWMLVNDLDFETSRNVPLEFRFPFYEFAILHHEKLHEEIRALNNNKKEVVDQLALWRRPGYAYLPDYPEPRMIKTHLPFTLLPPDLVDTCKVIYLARNPKDVAASYYHHNKLLSVHGYSADFEQYWNYFQEDLIVYSPYFEHIKEGWERRNHPNVKFVFYEDLVKDLPSKIRELANFLNKPITEDNLDKLVKHLQIDNFRLVVPVHPDVPMEGMLNTKAEGFIRKGKVGNAPEYTEELTKRADEWIANQLKHSDIVFPTK